MVKPPKFKIGEMVRVVKTSSLKRRFMIGGYFRIAKKFPSGYYSEPYYLLEGYPALDMFEEELDYSIIRVKFKKITI